MRRLLALVLLCFLVGTPFAASIALAQNQQVVPVCCRAHGKHQCMLHALGIDGRESADAHLRAPACEFAHHVTAAVSSAAIAPMPPGQPCAMRFAGLQPGRPTAPAIPRLLAFGPPRAPPVLYPS